MDASTSSIMAMTTMTSGAQHRWLRASGDMVGVNISGQVQKRNRNRSSSRGEDESESDPVKHLAIRKLGQQTRVRVKASGWVSFAGCAEGHTFTEGANGGSPYPISTVWTSWRAGSFRRTDPSTMELLAAQAIQEQRKRRKGRQRKRKE